MRLSHKNPITTNIELPGYNIEQNPTESSADGTLIYIKKKLYGPFLWMGFNCLKARATSRRQFTFYH